MTKEIITLARTTMELLFYFIFSMPWPIVPVGSLKSFGSTVKLPPIISMLGPISPPKCIFGVTTW
ncbi:hypothetical protein E2C01_074471 [Portunus trituberculatus]|uniref:Uncharacterized protein n=1 Tax=Portunus trituberculatus TaxID=210409 RepID=A0A5B7IHB9_PORTR|nr:hypothetical protein [Portunus trituberculatus]